MTLKKLTYFLIMAFIFISLFNLEANADLFGFQLSDTTLTKAGSPHLIIGDWEISTGVTVTVEPGAVIEFKDTSDLLGGNDFSTLTEIIVKGTLYAVGIATDSIVFESDTALNLAGRWGQIKSSSGGKIIIKYATINGAKNGVNIASVGNDTVMNSLFIYNQRGITLEQRGLVIENTIMYSSGPGVFIPGDSIKIKKLRVIEGDSVGIFSTGNHDTISQAIVMQNNRHGIFAFYHGGPKSLFVINSVISLNKGRGINVFSDAGDAYLYANYNTIHQNEGDGVYIYTYMGSNRYYIKNCIVTQNGGQAFSRSAISSDTMLYSNIWNNGTDINETMPTNTSINPLYVNTDTNNLDLHLQSISPLKVIGENGTEMGAYGGQYYGYPKAKVTMKTPVIADTADTIYTIEFGVADADSPDIAFNLYYDTDLNNLSKTLIASNIQDTIYEWDTRNLPNGEYYLFVEVVDGPSYDYSDNILTVLHSENTPPVISNDDTTISLYPGSTDTIIVNTSDIDNDVITFSSSGNDYTTIIQNDSVFYIVAISLGTDTVNLIASDGEAYDTMEVIVQVMSVSLENSASSIPAEFSLNQNQPNPFNPTTTINFTIPQKAIVTLTVLNIKGGKVADLIHNRNMQGKHTVAFDAGNLPSGIYLFKLQAGDYSAVRRGILMK